MKYNHTKRISLSCYEYGFRTWPLYEWSVKGSTTHSTVEISKKPPPPFPQHTYTEPPPFPQHTYTEIIQRYCHCHWHCGVQSIYTVRQVRTLSLALWGTVNLYCETLSLALWGTVNLYCETS